MLRGGFALIAILGLALAGPATADTLTLEMDGIISGDTPGGTAPWVTATFEDVVGGVELTVSGSGLVDSEFLTQAYFNVDPAIDPEDLTFTYVSGIEADSVLLGTDSFKADGDGFFDILLSYPNAPPGDRFGSGDESVYLISGAGIEAEDFCFESAPGGGQGIWFAAGKVQGIGEGAEGSSWIGADDCDLDEPNGEEPPPPPVIPEPSTLILIGSGLAGLALRRRNK